jgi:hypothetical protein
MARQLGSKSRNSKDATRRRRLASLICESARLDRRSARLYVPGAVASTRAEARGEQRGATALEHLTVLIWFVQRLHTRFGMCML